MNKQESLAKFSTVDVGDCCRLEQCCREIRYGAIKTGQALTGWNTLTDEYEEFVVEKLASSASKSLVRRIK